jgi:type III secretion protein U
MADNTEEKKHAPTARRLSQLRMREGQVPRSKDFPAAISLLCAAIYVMVNFGPIWRQIAAVFDIYEMFLRQGDTQTLLYVFKSAMQISAMIVLPVAVIASATYVLASVIQTKGFVISFKSMAPNFAKLNPVEGFQNIFGMQGVSEAIKITIKLLLMAIAVYVILRLTINGLFWSPTCEEDCVLQATIYIVLAVIIAALLIFFIVGLIDIRISSLLFSHRNRMSQSELERDIKDDMGSKEIRQRRGELRREDARNPSVRGFGKATVIVWNGDALVGLAYVPGKYDIPYIVGKLYKEKVAESLAEAKAKGVPIIQDEAFVTDLMRYSKVGEPLPQALIPATVQAFHRHGLVKRN